MPAPVLERFLDEICDRHDQPAQIPSADRDESERDVFDPPELAFYEDHVIDQDRLAQRDLTDTCE